MPDSYLAPATQREARFVLLVEALRTILRHDDPHLDDEALVTEAAFHAARRLSGGTLVPSFVGRPG